MRKLKAVTLALFPGFISSSNFSHVVTGSIGFVLSGRATACVDRWAHHAPPPSCCAMVASSCASNDLAAPLPWGPSSPRRPAARAPRSCQSPARAGQLAVMAFDPRLASARRLLASAASAPALAQAASAYAQLVSLRFNSSGAAPALTVTCHCTCH